MCARSGNWATECSRAAITSAGSGKQNTGRPKVASLMNTSQGTGSKGGQVGSRRRL
jgi:hypothetical protein